MFSQMSICHSVHHGDYLLDLTVQGPPPVHGTSLYGDPSGHGTSLYKNPLLVTSVGHHWRPVETSSLTRWYLVAIEASMVGANGRYASSGMLSCFVHDVTEPPNTQLQVRDFIFLRQHRSSTRLETKYLENQWSMLLFVYLLFCFTLVARRSACTSWDRCATTPPADVRYVLPRNTVCKMHHLNDKI